MKRRRWKPEDRTQNTESILYSRVLNSVQNEKPIKLMSEFRDSLDSLFVHQLGYEFTGITLPKPGMSGSDNILEISKEYSVHGVDIILTICKDRIPEFQKQVIKYHKTHFPSAHFLFVSNHGKVWDIYNGASSKKLRPITYDEIQKNTRLFKEKIQLFDVEDASGAVDLKIRIDKAFAIDEKITRKFYDKFKGIHEKLQKAISGISDKDDKSWYASVLLNRIMFIYFLQKHYVIQNDPEFLLNKFDEAEKRGEDYYKDFLLPLFFYGFAKKDHDQKKKEFTAKYGPVRYLNGGLFYAHSIEVKYCEIAEVVENGLRMKISDPMNSKISVKPKVIKEILQFLTGYTWYLDHRPMKNENEINPDVLGFIFEKYINQKELGAYYTKEDITNYNSKNTIIPFIFDKIRSKGFDAPDPNPMITNNEDIEQNILDYLEGVEDYELLKFIYKDILLLLSVLDLAVGSGAFLFAALNVLLPIYQKLVFKLKSFRRTQNDPWLAELYKTLDEHSEEYFLTKQIILNNLYGVDIVEEATEICKLRLFLQLASHLPDIQQIEPLPDIDFNIYAGNSLVGGLSWEDLHGTYGMDIFTDENQLKSDVEKLSALKQEYRTTQQNNDDENKLKSLKEEIQVLEKTINHAIGMKIGNAFHWFIEFNDIIARGGFDVIIGNPPYLEVREVDYEISGYATLETGTIHAMFIERAAKMLQSNGCMSMIVPLSLVSTQRMKIAQEILEKGRNAWYANFSWRPGKLFDTVNRALTIFVITPSATGKTYSTNYQKWNAEERNQLMDRIRYIETTRQRPVFWVPKLGHEIEKSILARCLGIKTVLLNFLSNSNNRVYYRTTGGLYWKVFTDFPPGFKVNGKPGHSTRETWFTLEKKKMVSPIIAILSSNLFWWWYTVTSNCRDLNPYDIQNFHIPESVFEDEQLEKLGKQYIKDLNKNSVMLERKQKQTGRTETQSFKIQKSKPIIDEIDRVLATHYGFTEEELDFIINYDIRFRMGKESAEEEE